jgi:hypothetical protein
MIQEPEIRRVAVVLFDGFTVLDAYGPIQAFGACRRLQPDGTHLRFFREHIWNEDATNDPFA